MAITTPDGRAGEDQHHRLTVADTGFLLERLSLEAGPLLFIRELTRNSFDAGATQVTWDIDWDAYAVTKVPKLCIVDNGHGMTAEELVVHFGRLFSTGRTLGHTENFGVGGKISTAIYNPAGVEVRSWRNGAGHVIVLRSDPATGEYGLAGIGADGGPVREATPAERPDGIGKHGTMIVLHGASPKALSADPPDGMAKKPRWLWSTLNRRFFDMAPGATLEVRVGTGKRRSVAQNPLVSVPGMRATLNAAAEASGEVSLSGAMALWWLLPADNNPDVSMVSGHAGLLFQGEAYDQFVGAAGVAKLQRLGVLVGTQRVVVYIVPHARRGQVLAPNTARTHLLLDSSPLDWTGWEAEFSARLPGPIRDAMATYAADAADNYREGIYRRLRNAHGQGLFSLSRWLPADRLAEAREQVAARDAAPSPKPTKTAERRAAAATRAEAKDLGVSEEVVSGMRPKRFENYTEVAATVEAADDRGEQLPGVTWVSVVDGSRVAGDLEDRPARYVRSRNHLIINRDFTGFGDMVDRWAAEYPSPTAGPVIEAKVREWVEQMLCEAVLAALELVGRPEWPDEQIDELLSPTGLTNALGPRLQMHDRLRSEFARVLGSARSAAA